MKSLIKSRKVGQRENRTDLPGRTLTDINSGEEEARSPTSHPDLPAVNNSINDSYCLSRGTSPILTQNFHTEETMNNLLFSNVKPRVQICSFCTQASTKERYKSRSARMSVNRASIKICEKCFLCHSIVLCQSCLKCNECCPQSACRGQTSKFLENLAGPGCRSETDSNPPRGLHPPLSDPAKTHQNAHNHKLLCQSSQEQLPVRGIASAYREKCCRTGLQSDLVRVLQPTLLVPKPNDK